MRHNQNKHSTANHGNSQHQKRPNYDPDSFNAGAHYQSKYEAEERISHMQNPKRSVLSRIRGRFQEKPATSEEVAQLKLQAQKETYKTAIHKAKSARPGRLDRISGGFGGGGGQSTGRRSSRQSESGLFGNSNSGSWLMGPSQGPSLNFITGVEEKKGRGRKEESVLGKGLTDLF